MTPSTKNKGLAPKQWRKTRNLLTDGLHISWGCMHIAVGDGRAAVQQHWLPQLAAFQPDLLLISAGFDAHREDSMAGMSLQDEDYRWVTLELKKLANECCQGRIVSMLEGGYALPALARSAFLHVQALVE